MGDPIPKCCRRSADIGRAGEGGPAAELVRVKPSRFAAAIACVLGVAACTGPSSAEGPRPTGSSPSATPQAARCLSTGPANRLRYLQSRIRIGEALFRLQIASIGVDTIVVQGVTQRALMAGAGHYPDTPLPGEQGNVGVAGHVRLYGAPFAHLNQLHAGALIQLTTPFRVVTYEVVPHVGGHGNPWIVDANQYQVLGQFGSLGRGHWLTLTATAGADGAKRLVLRATLIKSGHAPTAICT